MGGQADGTRGTMTDHVLAHLALSALPLLVSHLAASVFSGRRDRLRLLLANDSLRAKGLSFSGATVFQHARENSPSSEPVRRLEAPALARAAEKAKPSRATPVQVEAADWSRSRFPSRARPRCPNRNKSRCRRRLRTTLRARHRLQNRSHQSPDERRAARALAKGRSESRLPRLG